MSGPNSNGHHYTYRPSEPPDRQFAWRHPLEMRPDDVDCTDMDDEEFEKFVRSVTP